jgi:hypothetical protein
MADSLGEVLKAGRWERALFTTYSLSLTFFESIILRALREAECSEIWVVADADGYRSSLMERGSSGVGHEYRLVPIGLRNGVFHAKCCYLAGPDGDLLLVGSGSLTFGGYGRNLEVLETLSSTLHPKCFLAFADFLTGLKSRRDVICPDFEWADSFANRAREASTNSEAEEYPRLLTSLEQPIKDQLATTVGSYGEAEHVTILSPFFDPDGRAVLDLATETKTHEVRIALPLGNEQTSFPFPRTRRWPVKVSSVTLSRDDDNRKLHAKWMEWKTSYGILTLTGSMNATRQALSNSNNIEIGILRLAENKKGWAAWRRASNPSSYQARIFTRSGIGTSYLVFGELLDSGDLRGRIVSISSPVGTWSGELQRPNGDSIGFTVTVKDDGYFSHPHLTADEDFLFASGLQISLKTGDCLARGWITNVTILNLPKAHRISVSSLIRLINREETEEDDAALLEYFALHALDHFKTFETRVIAQKVSQEESTQASEDFSIDLEYLRPDPHPSARSLMSRDPVLSAGLALERVLAQLRRRLLGHVSKADRRSPPPAGSPGGDEQEPDSQEDIVQAERARERLDSALDVFMESMENLATLSELSDAHRRAVLVIWVEVALHMLVRRKHELSEAASFLRHWFWLATSLTAKQEETDSLEQHVVTSAAILATVKYSTLLDLHERLEHYWQGSVDQERAIRGLLPQSRLSIASFLLESSQWTLEDGLRRVLDTTTLRDELEKLLSGDRLLAEDSPLFGFDAGKELRDELQARGAKARIELLEDRRFSCPKEFITLSEACKGELQKNRVARCSVCGRLIVRITP